MRSEVRGQGVLGPQAPSGAVVPRPPLRCTVSGLGPWRREASHLQTRWLPKRAKGLLDRVPRLVIKTSVLVRSVWLR